VGRGVSSLTRTTSNRYWAGSENDPDVPATPIYHSRKRNRERKTLAAGNATVDDIKNTVLSKKCCAKLGCPSRFKADAIHEERKKIHSVTSQIDRRVALIKYIESNDGSTNKLLGISCCQVFWFRAMGVSQRLLRRAVARDEKPRVKRGGTQPLSRKTSAVIDWLAAQSETGDRQPDVSEIHLHGNSKLTYIKKYREEAIKKKNNLPYVSRPRFYAIWAKDAPGIKVKRQVHIILRVIPSNSLPSLCGNVVSIFPMR